MNLNYLLALILLFSKPSFSQIVSEINPPQFIKTITFKSSSAQSELPVLKLGESLSLEFDVLNGDEADFYCVIDRIL